MNQSTEGTPSDDSGGIPTQLEALSGNIRRGKSGKVRAADFSDCGTSFTDQHAQLLSSFPDLTHLELAGTAIGDEALETIGRLEKLKHLDLQRTRITSHGLPHLESLGNLKLLLLSGTDLSREQLKPLRQKLLGTRIVFP